MLQIPVREHFQCVWEHKAGGFVTAGTGEHPLVALSFHTPSGRTLQLLLQRAPSQGERTLIAHPSHGFIHGLACHLLPH